ncbi:MAG TPA: futalosine hydrolase [Chitinophagaceae bacterium]|nr:futalosine hydrolase [Chitinophagaceae bacterium]
MKTFESMNTYIVAATMAEIEPLIEKTSTSDFKLIITGVGSAATTFQLTKLLATEKPDLIIQAGIAGSFDNTLPLGTTVAVLRDRFADLGVEENNQWKDVFDLNLANKNDFPHVNGWLNNEGDLIKNVDIPTVTSITINEVTTNPSRISQFSKKYQPVIESMEGAAFHYACLQYKIPFLQLRSVSNYIGERDKNKWQIAAAIEDLNKRIIDILDKN